MTLQLGPLDHGDALSDWYSGDCKFNPQSGHIPFERKLVMK